jgi:hypothetical protein
MATLYFLKSNTAFQLDSGLGSGAVKVPSSIGNSELEASLAGTTGAKSLIWSDPVNVCESVGLLLSFQFRLLFFEDILKRLTSYT